MSYYFYAFTCRNRSKIGLLPPKPISMPLLGIERGVHHASFCTAIKNVHSLFVTEVMQMKPLYTGPRFPSDGNKCNPLVQAKRYSHRHYQPVTNRSKHEQNTTFLCFPFRVHQSLLYSTLILSTATQHRPWQSVEPRGEPNTCPHMDRRVEGPDCLGWPEWKGVLRHFVPLLHRKGTVTTEII